MLCAGIMCNLLLVLAPQKFLLQEVIFFFFSFVKVLGFPDSSAGKESACNAGDPGSIPGSGDPLEEG